MLREATAREDGARGQRGQPASGFPGPGFPGHVSRHSPSRGGGSGLPGAQEAEAFHEPVPGAGLGVVCGEGEGSLVGSQPLL